MASVVGGCARPGAVENAKQMQHADALVTMRGFEFNPKQVVILSGQSVEWNNTAAMETHTVTADPKLAKTHGSVALPAGAETFDSGDMKPGATFTHTFTVPGTYRYFCKPHERMGMVGEIVVKEK
jgi:plastocyanin